MDPELKNRMPRNESGGTAGMLIPYLVDGSQKTLDCLQYLKEVGFAFLYLNTVMELHDNSFAVVLFLIQFLWTFKCADIPLLCQRKHGDMLEIKNVLGIQQNDDLKLSSMVDGGQKTLECLLYLNIITALAVTYLYIHIGKITDTQEELKYILYPFIGNSLINFILLQYYRTQIAVLVDKEDLFKKKKEIKEEDKQSGDELNTHQPGMQLAIRKSKTFEPPLDIMTKIADGNVPGPQVTMTHELLRIYTLRNYPKDNKPYLTQLAAAGFYYAAEGDEVICYCCGLRRRSYVDTHVPERIHRRMNTNCKYLNRNHELNVSVTLTGTTADLEKNELLLTLLNNEPTVSAEEGNNDSQSEGPLSKPKQKSKFHDFPLRSSPAGINRHVDKIFDWRKAPELPVPNYDITVALLTGSQTFEPLLDIMTKIADGNAPGPQVTMRYELLRICTLRNYPKDNKPYLIQLAAAGFYYAAEGDEVICYCCGLRRHSWVGTDVPERIHRRINPNCKYLNCKHEFNVPVTFTGTTSNLDKIELFLTMLNEGPVSSRAVSAEEGGNDFSEYAPANPSVRGGASTVLSNPKHPQYILKSQRISSFKGWPYSLAHTPEIMAEAGFYYTVFRDCVRCYYCGIGISLQTLMGNAFGGADSDNSTKCINQKTNRSKEKDEELKKETDRLREKSTCRICKKRPRTIVFMPCGHFYCCEICAKDKIKCSMCGQNITDAVQAKME